MSLKDMLQNMRDEELEVLADFFAKFFSSENGKFLWELSKTTNLSELQPYMEDDVELKKADKEGITFGELLADRERFMGIVERAKQAYEASKQPLPKMPKKPQSYTTATNLLMQKMTAEEVVNAGAFDLPVWPEKGITTYVAMAYEKEKNPFGLTPKQITVLEAVDAVYNQGKKDGMEGPVPMTPVSIFKAMPGGSTKPTPAKLKEIEKTFSMFRDMPAEIEATAELRAAGKIGQGEKFHLKTNMILARELRYTRKNGTETIGWQVFEPPIASTYAKKQGQIVSVPSHVVQIQEVSEKTKEPNGKIISMNDNRRELLAYMVRRVGVMHNDCRKARNEATKKRNREAGKTWKDLTTKSHSILYETAFEAAGIETKRAATIMELRDFMLEVLKYWKVIGYIYGYEEIKTKQQRKGLKILFE
jgi:hypothetical protein